MIGLIIYTVLNLRMIAKNDGLKKIMITTTKTKMEEEEEEEVEVDRERLPTTGNRNHYEGGSGQPRWNHR